MRTGPEDAILRNDLLIGNPSIVGGTTSTRSTQLFKNLACISKLEVLSLTQTLRQLAQDLKLIAHLRWSREGTLAQDNTTFQISHRPFLLGPLRHRQHNIG